MSRSSSDEGLQRVWEAGQHPARFAPLVRLARRLLWPLIKPYHHRQLDLCGETKHGGGPAEARDLAALRGEIRAMIHRMALLESGNEAARSDTFVANTPVGVMFLVAGDPISEAIGSSGEWDGHLLTIFDEVAAGDGGTAIDAGAHVGFHTLSLATRFQRVMAFEANLYLFRLLRTNTVVNALAHVTCVPSPLYSRETDLALAGAAGLEVGARTGADLDLGAVCSLPDGSETLLSPARTIDSYDLSDLRLLKIDCRGTDGEIILGAIETIRRCKPVVVFEWQDILAQRHSVNLDEVRNLLEQSGYDIEVLYRQNERQVDYVARPR